MAKKKKVDAKEQERIKRQKAFQDRLPIKAIHHHLFVTKDGEFLPVFVLGQKSINLMSEDERAAFAKTLEQTFQGLNVKAFQFLLLPIPFDLAPYEECQNRNLTVLQKQQNILQTKIAEDTNNTYQQKVCSDLLEQNLEFQKHVVEQTDFVKRRMQSGKVANKRSYIIARIKDSYNEIAVQEAAKNIEQKLSGILQDSHRCSEKEMEKILVEIYNPLRPEIYINN